MNKDVKQSNNFLGFFFVLLPVAVLNPMLLSKAGANFEGTYTVVVLACALGCIASAAFERAMVMLPSTGLCAYLVYAVILSEGIPLQGAMGAVLIASIFSGLVFFFGGFGFIRKILPPSLCRGLMAGLGLMLVYRGLVDGGIIINSPMGGSTLGNMVEPVAYLSLIGMLATWIFISKGLKAAFAIGSLAVICAALFIGFIELPVAPFSLPEGLEYTVFQVDFGYMDRLILVIMGIFLVMTIQGMAVYEGLGEIKHTMGNETNSESDGAVSKRNRAVIGVMGVICPLFGAGPSTVSEAGFVAETEGADRKARFIAGMCFLPLLFLGPLLRELVALQAFYVPAMIFSGFMLFASVYRSNPWEKLGRGSFPEFLTLIMMPLTGDIISSLVFGIIAHMILCTVRRETRKIHPVCILMVIFFILMLFFAHGGVFPK